MGVVGVVVGGFRMEAWIQTELFASRLLVFRVTVLPLTVQDCRLVWQLD